MSLKELNQALAENKAKVAELIKEAQSGGNTDELEAIIDNSGVLDSTEGTITEKLEQLVVYKKTWNEISGVSFQRSQAKSIDVYIDFPHLNGNALFRDASNLIYIKGVNTSKCSDMRYFISGTKVEIIELPIDVSSVTQSTQLTSAFATTALKEIRFVKGSILVNIDFRYCSLLSAESIQSIIDGLATVETAQTLTLHADVKAKLTDEQKATATAKNWSIA